MQVDVCDRCKKMMLKREEKTYIIVDVANTDTRKVLHLELCNNCAEVAQKLTLNQYVNCNGVF